MRNDEHLSKISSINIFFSLQTYGKHFSITKLIYTKVEFDGD